MFICAIAQNGHIDIPCIYTCQGDAQYAVYTLLMYTYSPLETVNVALSVCSNSGRPHGQLSTQFQCTFFSKY